jgi:aspartyl-tRNA(Asn)/glutamyl-tRNA(Gln) amidotransferase subunit B
MSYETIIGLEVHAQLLTKSKLFCACPTAFGSPQNKNTCPVCLALPGALPVLNRRTVDLAILAGLALQCEIQSESVWERKNYFYQDLPKGYQITQFAKPLCLKGHLDLNVDGKTKRVGITRIHMEEDAGKSLHEGDEKYTRVDLNRAGTPLIEIVSEPDMRNAAEAGEYLRTLRSIVRYTGVCDGNMEEGSMRCDANVSIRPVGQKEFGTKVELKNINSVKFLEKAIAYEIERQKAVLADGEKIVQETRGYDNAANKTYSMRTKEDAHDYRYFPDPDLVPLLVDSDWIERCRMALPELAVQKAARFVTQYGIPEYDAGVLTADKALSEYFERAVKTHDNTKKISNWIMSELLRELKNDDREISQCPVKPEDLATLVKLIDDGAISGKIAKTVFEEMYKSGKAPEAIIKEQGLVQVSDTGAIEKIIDEVIAANPEQYAQYKSGKDKLFGFFVGQTMKALQGQGNPGVINDLLKKKL